MTTTRSRPEGMTGRGGAATLRCEPLFAPKSIAVVGVSASDPLSWGRITLHRLTSSGYDGELIAVSRSEVDLPRTVCVRSLSELSSPPDLVVIAVPAASVPDTLIEARRMGAGAAVVYASGFADVGNAELERKLKEAAGDMPVLGPNCLGIVNHAAGVQVSTSGFLDRERVGTGPVAVVSQSGALGFVLADLLERAGLGYTYYASVGNEACLSATDVGGYLIEQPEVQTLVLYLEGVRDAASLRALGDRARQLGKSVVALTVGRSAAGRQAALSHTAAAAGDHLLLSSLCRQAGITLVETDDQLVDAVLCAHKGATLPESPAFAVLTMSGGAGGVLADNLTAIGARVHPLGDATRAELAAIGAVEAGDLNPVDLGGGFVRSLSSVEALLDVLDRDPTIDAIVLYLTFGDRFMDDYRHIATLASKTRSPTWFIWACAPGGALEEVNRPGTVVGSIGAFTRLMTVLIDGKGSLATPRLPEARVAAPNRTTWSEMRAAPVLRAAGIPYTPWVSAEDPSALSRAVRAAGWTGKLVVKGDASDVPHRALEGLVRLGVDEADLPRVAAEVHARLAACSTDAGARLVAQPLIEHDSELALGAVRDQIYGTAVLIGAGGNRAEDRTAPRRALILPACSADIEALADWAAREFGGRRAALVGAVRALISVLEAGDGIAEVDINPLCVVDDGVVAVDALITLSVQASKEIAHV